MSRRVLVRVVAVGAVALGVVAARAVPASATPIALVLPQGTAFSYIGHSCGGIQEKAYATGFDGTSGFPTGDVYMSTRCGGSGRGGGYHVTTYSAWAAVTWDFTGAVIASAPLSGAPSVNPTLTAFDANGNEVYNQSGSAFLSLSPTYVPVPRVTGVSVSQGPSSGGTSVTISGTGFTNATAVDFGSAPAASVTVSGDTSITVVSPSAPPGTVPVSVSSAGGTSAPSAAAQFTFVGAPVVSGLSPDNGPVSQSTTVTIAGENLAGTTAVTFGDMAAGFIVNSDTSITAYGPVGEAPDSVDVHVQSVGGTSASSPADVFTYTSGAVPGAFSITTLSLPAAARGTAYHAKVQATGGSGPYRWRMSGSLPRGLKLRRSGLLSGTPRAADQPGSYVIVVSASTRGTITTPVHTATRKLTLTLR